MKHPVIRSIGIRITSVLVTLWLLSLVVFACGHLLPGDVGRAILGPLADAQAVSALNHRLGTDLPLASQYLSWLRDLVHGNLGTSLVLDRPVSTLLFAAFERSLALACLTLLLVIPLCILAGFMAAVRAGGPRDWGINLVSMGLSSVPEFIWSIALVLVFSISLHWLPLFATAEPGANLATRIGHLILPAAALSTGLFGYLTRIIRVSALQELHEHYTRTAVLKGLAPHVVILRHVLRNALQPAVAVIGTQLGYLIGGLVAVEALFRYPGIGGLVLHAANTRDFPLLQGSLLLIGLVYTIGTQLSDVLSARLDPSHRKAH